MKGREAFGYVVSIEGSKIALNLKDTYKGQYASHRDGVSSVAEISSLFGVDAGPKILVLRVISLSFVEPKEVHKIMSPRTMLEPEPLRQLIGTVTGWLYKEHGHLIFMPDSLASPSLGAEAFPLSADELAAIIRVSEDKEGSLLLGRDSRGGGNLEVDVSNFLGRHVAVLGSTGQGKSCFIAAIVQQILKYKRPRVILFDINGEYLDAVKPHIQDESKLKVTTLGGDNATLKIPYFALGRHGLSRLLLPSEKTQRPALSFAIDHLCHVKWFNNENAAGVSSDTQPSLYDDCPTDDASQAWQRIIQLRQGQVSLATEWPFMGALSCLIAESHSIKPKRSGGGYERDAFLYGNIAPLITRIKRLIDDQLFTSVIDVDGGPAAIPGNLNWAKEGSRLISDVFGDTDSKWLIHLLDMRNVAHDLMPLVLGSFLELLAFELFHRGQGNTYPTLLILEEAHHYLRQYISDEDSTYQSLAYERLAKEGRKFGLGLVISTQRPAEVSPTVLAQCGTWVVFRLTSEHDLRAVSSAGEWVEHLELNRISGLPRQQALVFGACVPVPVRVIAPTADPIPKSLDPNFKLWLKD